MFLSFGRIAANGGKHRKQIFNGSKLFWRPTKQLFVKGTFGNRASSANGVVRIEGRKTK